MAGPTSSNKLLTAADAYLRGLARVPFWQFVLTLYTVSLLAQIVVMAVLTESAQALGHQLPQYHGDEQRSLLNLFVGGVLLAPLLETWLNQTLPLWLGRFYGWRPVWPILGSTVVFGLLHYHRLLAGVVNSLVLGLIFALAYWYRQQQIGGRPYLAITSVHALHNLLAWSVTWWLRSGMMPAS